eukprot:s1259_g4.t1
MKGGQTEDGLYEGGTALAPQAEKEHESFHQSFDPGTNPYEALVKSMIDAALPFEGATEPPSSVHSPDPLDKGSDCVRRGAKKDSPEFAWAGCQLNVCGDLLFKELLGVLPLRSQDMGRPDKDCAYPLPTSRSSFLSLDPELRDCELSWMVCVTSSLNSFYGGLVWYEGDVNETQKACLNHLMKDVKRFTSINADLPDLSWDDLFSVRSIDYKGDEVKVAKWFGWDNIAPALPKEVGKVPLDEVRTLGCREYVLNFEQYLKPQNEWVATSPPRVMVSDHDWPSVCQGLLASGVCELIVEHEVFHTSSGPLLNGLFGVAKDEVTDEGVDIYRLIMNLIPLNNLCKPLAGDVDSLPSWSTMSPFFLQPNERLLVSSEDVKCFFYTMSVPACWTRFLAFNKLVPESVLPEALKGERVYVASKVLPMGFLNSVSLAQHVHRNLARWSSCASSTVGVNVPEAELRKDRAFSSHNPNWRIYLDNFDLLEKVKACEAASLEGTCAPGILALRQEYERWEVPRNLKKSVQRSSLCELQGATVDGEAGVAYPRESKMAKYFGLAVKLCLQTRATQKQWQVVCGGLVYISMFRRPLLGSLNQVWQHILSFDRTQRHTLPTPMDCKLEVLRFLGMLPLARLDFRLDMHPMVSCSDASLHGGGICASTSLTPLGGLVAEGALRGEIPEPAGDMTVFSVGLFDGIGALRVALETVNVKVLGHVSAECNIAAQRVVESHFPGVEVVNSVQEIDEEMVSKWACRYSQCSLVLLGAGPPCQGVSGLNPDRKGALRDERSCLFSEVPRVRDLLRQAFPWCPVHALMESVASMDVRDRQIMSQGFGDEPLMCDAGCLTWCHRPRLYWLTWEISESDGVSLDRSGDVCTLKLEGHQDLAEVTRSGWHKWDAEKPFPTFTTSRPRDRPGRKPAGVKHCSLTELERWHKDSFRFPPYQYKDDNSLYNGAGEIRIPDVSEREVMMGFPLHYTATAGTKAQQKEAGFNDVRLTLLGNSWSVPVVSVLLSHLFSWLGWIRPMSPQMVLDACRPATHEYVQGRLFRLPLNPSRKHCDVSAYKLAFKLGNLVSIKGEDILLSTPTSQMTKFHRLRASVPSKLWRWKVITGWKWKHGKEHINSLELRAVLTSLRWRLEKLKHTGCRLVHLTDSLVCLHTLSRGRSSSRRLRRTMARVNALVLAGRGQAADTLAGLQDLQPDLRHHLPGAWRLLKTWSINEIPARAAPFPEHVVQAMAGWAFFKGWNSFGVSLILAFYTMLRTAEILSLRSSHLLCGPRDKQVVVSLGMTKGGKRQGAAESVILGYEPAVHLVKRWKQLATLATPLVRSSAHWRKLFNECLTSLGIEDFMFRPYSLRRGGATYWFGKHQSLDRLLVQGRWASQRTARIYINEGLAMLDLDGGVLTQALQHRGFRLRELRQGVRILERAADPAANVKRRWKVTGLCFFMAVGLYWYGALGCLWACVTLGVFFLTFRPRGEPPLLVAAACFKHSADEIKEALSEHWRYQEWQPQHLHAQALSLLPSRDEVLRLRFRVLGGTIRSIEQRRRWARSEGHGRLLLCVEELQQGDVREFEGFAIQPLEEG